MVKRSREDFDTPSTTESKDSPESATNISSSSSPSDPGVNASESSKLLHIDTESCEASAPTEVMRCSLPPHSRQVLSFASFEDYEVHYNKTHVNRCVECRKNFPTPHFLDLHIFENHNPLLEVLKNRGERTVSKSSFLHHPSPFYKELKLNCIVLSILALLKTVIENALPLRNGACTSSTSTCSRKTMISM